MSQTTLPSDNNPFVNPFVNLLASYHVKGGHLVLTSVEFLTNDCYLAQYELESSALTM